MLEAAGPGDAVLGVQPERLATPASEEQVATTLRWADRAGLAVVPRGGGTKLDWGNPPARADLILSTKRLDRIVDHPWDDLTVTVEAGCTFAKLQAALAAHGQRLAIDPLFPEETTIGGLLSTNDSGALRVRFGSLRDLVIGATLALADGTLARSGGRVVKNVAGYDLQKLATGALGTLGVLTQATFRLYPVPHGVRTASFDLGAPADANRLILALHDSKIPFSGLQVRLSAGETPSVDVRLEGTTAGLDAQALALQEIAGKASAVDEAVWNAREGLFDGDVLVAKVSVLPSKIALFQGLLAQKAAACSWASVFQGTGLGLLRLGPPNAAVAVIGSLRDALGHGESVVVLKRPAGLILDSWGSPGDAIGLMRAVKAQFDPNGTINPGRFVGGI